LIVSNLPGKAGVPVITSLLQDAGRYLAPGGMAAIVVVNPLEALVNGILADTPGIEIVLHRKSGGHAVFHYRFPEHVPEVPEESAFNRGVYRRAEAVLHPKEQSYAMKTAWGLPEFDSLSYDTAILLRALHNVPSRKIEKAVVFNPRQGHAAVFLWRLAKPESIILIDRDRLALRNSRLNLLENGCPPERIELLHQVGLALTASESADLITGVIREEEGQSAARISLDEAVTWLAPGGLIVLAGSSTAITRLVKHAETINALVGRHRDKIKGYSSIVLERTRQDKGNRVLQTGGKT
ncbi:MAG: hypothetical protein MUO19_07460, partial [Dehalococcoidales bacterium]|nr:hypothetical protein [Dehalococcoidales bacterium]